MKVRFGLLIVLIAYEHAPRWRKNAKKKIDQTMRAKQSLGKAKRAERSLCSARSAARIFFLFFFFGVFPPSRSLFTGYSRFLIVSVPLNVPFDYIQLACVAGAKSGRSVGTRSARRERVERKGNGFALSSCLQITTLFLPAPTPLHFRHLPRRLLSNHTFHYRIVSLFDWLKLNTWRINAPLRRKNCQEIGPVWQKTQMDKLERLNKLKIRNWGQSLRGRKFSVNSGNNIVFLPRETLADSCPLEIWCF